MWVFDCECVRGPEKGRMYNFKPSEKVRGGYNFYGCRGALNMISAHCRERKDLSIDMQHVRIYSFVKAEERPQHVFL